MREEGRLAGAVGTDEGSALAVVKFEVQILEQRLGIEPRVRPGCAEQQHADRIRSYGVPRKISITSELATRVRSDSKICCAVNRWPSSQRT